MSGTWPRRHAVAALQRASAARRCETRQSHLLSHDLWLDDVELARQRAGIGLDDCALRRFTDSAARTGHPVATCRRGKTHALRRQREVSGDGGETRTGTGEGSRSQFAGCDLQHRQSAGRAFVRLGAERDLEGCAPEQHQRWHGPDLLLRAWRANLAGVSRRTAMHRTRDGGGGVGRGRPSSHRQTG